MPIIRSKNFILRPLRISDAEELAKNAHDRTVYRNTLLMPYPYTKKDAIWWIKKNLVIYKKKKKNSYSFAIEIDGKCVGGIGLDKIVYEHKATIGYWIGRKYWGRGIMTEAVKLVSDWAFHEYKLKRLYAYAFPWNKASMRVMEKSGMKFEGVLKKNSLKNGKLLDDHVYAKVK